MNSRTPSGPNQYLLALLTALLSGAFASLGVYLTAVAEEEKEKLALRAESKLSAYTSFLDAVATGESRVVRDVQYIATLAEQSATDSGLQKVENHIAKLSSSVDAALLVELNHEFNVLRIHGSEAVRRNVQDILSALAGRAGNLNLSEYPARIQEQYIAMHPEPASIRVENISEEVREPLTFYRSIPVSDESYIDLKVSDEERFSIVVGGLLFGHLIETIRRRVDALVG